MRGRRTRRIVVVKQEQGLRDVMADEIAKRRQAYAAEITRRAASAIRGSKRPSPPCRARISPVRRRGASAPAASLAGRLSDDPARLYDDVLVAIDAEARHQQRPAVAARAVDRRAANKGGRDGRPDRRGRRLLHRDPRPSRRAGGQGRSPTRSSRTSPSAPRPTSPAIPRSRSAPAPASRTCPRPTPSTSTPPPRIRFGAWLDALKVGGRLLFPLQAAHSTGAMLLITRPERGDAWPARFLSAVVFIACEGAQDPAMGRKLDEAFRRGGSGRVRSLRFGGAPSRRTGSAATAGRSTTEAEQET